MSVKPSEILAGAKIMHASENDKPLSHYRHGDEDNRGSLIEAILDRNDDYMVYLTVTMKSRKCRSARRIPGIGWQERKESDGTRYTYNEAQKESFREFNRRFDVVTQRIPKTMRNGMLQSLGIALFNSLEIAQNSASDEARFLPFQRYDEAVDAQATEICRKRYARSALISSIVLVALSYVALHLPAIFDGAKKTYLEIITLGPGVQPLIVGAAFGALGALISVLTKYRSVQAGELSDGRINFARVHGLFRITLGFLLGMAAIAAAMTGILPGINAADQTFFHLVAIGTAGGFSERLIPDMLSRTNNS